MKTILSLAFAIFIMAGTGYAQTASFGIKGGLNVYNIHNSNNVVYDPVIGFHAGGLVHVHLTKSFALQPEVTVSTVGADYKSGPFETRYDLVYINTPLLFQYMFNNGLRMQAGPQVSFLVDAKTRAGNIKENVRSDFNSVDFGLTTGASYQVPKTGFGFDARYNFGLTNINSNGSVTSNNRGFQAGIFYLFHR